MYSGIFCKYHGENEINNSGIGKSSENSDPLSAVCLALALFWTLKTGLKLARKKHKKCQKLVNSRPRTFM